MLLESFCFSRSFGDNHVNRQSCQLSRMWRQEKHSVPHFVWQVAELQEAVRKLHSTREAKKELDSWFQAQSVVNSQPTAKNSFTGTHRTDGSQ